MAHKNIDSVSPRIQKEEGTASNVSYNAIISGDIKSRIPKFRIKKQHLQKLASAYLMLLMVFQSIAGVFIWVPKGNEAKATGNIYYVDSTIVDVNVTSNIPDCTNYDPVAFVCSGGSAFVYKTIADVNAGSFSSNDQILFRRGQLWRETLVASSSGSVGNPVTYGAFGSGANPIIDGTDLITGWTTSSPESVANGGFELWTSSNSPDNWVVTSAGTSSINQENSAVYNGVY